jgi:TPR repeat protein
MRLAILVTIFVALGSAATWAQNTGDIRKKASSGDAAAQFEMARHYVNEADSARNEKRALRDLKRAVEWYTKSAKQGFALAQFELGRLYILGRGVEQDRDRGVNLQIEAAEQGLPEAQFEIGLQYLSGTVLDHDLAAALDMFHKAAEQRHLPALKQLATMYFQAGGVEKDLVEAYQWFRIAAANDDKAAAGYLPIMESVMDEAQIEEARALAAQWQVDHMAE